MLDAARMLVNHGYELYATKGTSQYLTDNGIENTLVLWPSEEGEGKNNAPSALELLHAHKIDMVVNIPKDLTSHELTNGYKIRRAAIDLNVPLITNARLAAAFIQAFCNVGIEGIGIKAWGEY
jgi:carbamoyl-phosphate synthase large subunit